MRSASGDFVYFGGDTIEKFHPQFFFTAIGLYKLDKMSEI